MYSILIVDDEKIVKLAIKSMINWADSGFQLLGTASDGSRALEICEKTRPDIIITDLKMPHMDGIELIKKLKDTNYDGEILVLSNYNDFELVREAMKYGAHDYILKVTVSSEEFMRVLYEIKEKLDSRRGKEAVPQISMKDIEFERYNCLYKLWFGPENEAAAQTGAVSGMFASGRNECIQVFVVRCGDQAALEKTGQKVGEIIKNIAGNIFNKSNWISALDFENNSALVAVNFPTDEVKISPQETAQRIKDITYMYFNLKIGVIYGAFARDAQSLINEAGRSKRACELMFYESISDVCTDNKSIPDDNEQYVKELALSSADRIFNEVAGGNVEGILKTLESIIKAGEETLLNPFRLKKIIKRVLRDAEKRLMNLGICNEEIFDEYNTDEDVIFTAESEEALKLVLKNIFETAVQSIKTRKTYRKEIHEALKYIEDNIYRKITVPEVARRVNLTDTYLCRVFKSDVGKSMIDYINELKLKKAYELLISKNFLIKEAASAVGINDQFYFNRLFKKYFGITPKDIKHKN